MSYFSFIYTEFLKYWNTQKCLEDLTTFFMSTWWGGSKNMKEIEFSRWLFELQPIQPIWQHIFALPYSALKKLLWEFNFVHIFWISWSSRPKNVVKCWRDFLSYFTTLWIYREWLFLSLIGNNFCIWVFAQVHTSIPRFRRGSDLWF